jgi:hypothetical protein
MNINRAQLIEILKKYVVERVNGIMSDKIKFNWHRFKIVENSLSPTEEIVIEQHFNIWLDGNPDDGECSSPELQGKFNQFRSAWIMSQMFTSKIK